MSLVLTGSKDLFYTTKHQKFWFFKYLVLSVGYAYQKHFIKHSSVEIKQL